MHEIDGNRADSDASSDSEWQAPRTAEEYHLVSERRQSLLHGQQSGIITPQESEELARLTSLSREYATGVTSMFRDLFTGEDGRHYDLRSPEDRAEIAEKLRLFREGPRTTTDMGGTPIVPHQRNPHKAEN